MATGAANIRRVSRAEIMAKKKVAPDLKIQDASGLTDADWAQINKLRQALEQGGDKAFQKALGDLKKDPSRYLRVMRAFFPVRVREALRDSLANAGITEEDLRELAKVLRPARKH
jgi:hypothetical protein